MKALINKLIVSNTGFDTLPLRLAAGVIFAAHGAQKLFGWFGGYGLEGTAGWMDSIGLGPGMLMATLAGSAEFFGGLLLIIGLLVRPAALVLALTMLVAIVTVHLEHGLFMSNNGYEFGLALLVISVALAIRGAGSISADNFLQSKLTRPVS
jgi:putative oxidoreductase